VNISSGINNLASTKRLGSSGPAGPATPIDISADAITLDDTAMAAALLPAAFTLTETPPVADFNTWLAANPAIEAGQHILYTSPHGRPVHAHVVDDGSGNLSVQLITTTGAQLNAAAVAGAIAPDSIVVHFDDVGDLDHTPYVVVTDGTLSWLVETTYSGPAGGGGDVTSTQLAAAIAASEAALRLERHTKVGTRAERLVNTNTNIVEWYEIDFELWWDIKGGAWTLRA